MAFFDEGIYDPLTGALAPRFFYESSKRLISWANRTNRQTAVIAIRHEDLSDDELIRCATDLSSELRGGDLLARMNQKNFVLLLIGNQLGAEQLIFRLKNVVKFNLEFKSIELNQGEDIVTALARLGV